MKTLRTTIPTAIITPCSDFILSLFPKPCRPRKHHWCGLCGGKIEPLEDCCRWSGFGIDGPVTSHAHPECYDATRDWDDGDWEVTMQGDLERPEMRMSWPKGAGNLPPN